MAFSVPKPYVIFGLLAASRTCSPQARLFISPIKLVWLPLVCPILVLTIVIARILARTGVLTSLDPGVALTFLDRALNIQVTYGAVMLSFLGLCLRILLRAHLIVLNRGPALGNGIRWPGRLQRLFASRIGGCTCDLRLANTRF